MGIASAVGAQAQSHAPREAPVLQTAQLLSDLDTLEAILLSTHASVDRYRSLEATRAEFRRARAAVGRGDSTALSFFRSVSALLAGIRDGHTQVVATPDLMQAARGAAPRLPLELRFVRGHAFVTGTAAADIPLGCDISSIDGVDIRTLTDTIFSHLPADGDILTGKMAALGRNFAQYYFLFIGQRERFDVNGSIPRNASITVLNGTLTTEDGTPYQR